MSSKKKSAKKKFRQLKIDKSKVFLMLMTVFLVISLGALYHQLRLKNAETEYLTLISEIQILSQALSKNATEAANGSSDAFYKLRDTTNEFREIWKRLNNSENRNMQMIRTRIDKGATQDIKVMDDLWTKMSGKADKILSSQQQIVTLHELANIISKILPRLQKEYEQVLRVMVQNRKTSDQIAIASRQLFLSERMLGNISAVLEGTESSLLAANTFGDDAEKFGRVLSGMLEGDRAINVSKATNPAALETLLSISDQFLEVSENVSEILKVTPKLRVVRSSADAIFDGSSKLLDQAQKIEATLQILSNDFLLDSLIWGAGMCALLCLLLMLRENSNQIKQQLDNEARMRLVEEQQNQQNQNAILRLLDELSDLADGDLTIHTTVTEDFTGAIADSINFTIDQLRSLVSTINQTAVQVSSAAQETQSTAMHLAEASDHQAQEIAGASSATNEMALSIDQVSANAAESSSVAERSVTIASKGANVVKATINGMTNIREQIQETSKRIKRLGESSQEIGDIVSLITDIADQTNILALNAAIQASMAGDAGRGFAVVADEVQRLAEKASAATKQIEGLVKTIQTDTSEAVISMEHTTAEVVSGARLAQDAGVALEEIETVSTNLASLIQNISNAAKQQAASAGQISNTMNVIQEITSQTSAGTSATATSIGNLAHLAVQMRNSVAGFKLPEAKESGSSKSFAA